MGLIRKLKDKAGQVRAMEDQIRDRGGLATLKGQTATLSALDAQTRRLRVEGLTGRALIRATRDTGERLAGHVILDLDLVVTLDGGQPYETTLTIPIVGSDSSPFAPGTQYRVRVDPLDHDKLTFSA